ncbi:SMI1/KNR4 family protein [Neobacillus niacini]|uniref:SMI1/KNR4 family protein n=1 Tax=Neobacillus niacini TaxID=86668 RepID=UPI002FFFA39B
MINTYGLELKPPIEENKVKEVETELGVTFPNDYLEFISYSNGAEGSIGENYLILWSIEDIIELNEAYGVNDFAKGLVLFGSDGGDTAFAFDTRKNETQIVSVPFIGMDLSEITTCSNTFNGFLQYLLNAN